MKIALIYTGYLRTFDRCVQNHQASIWQRDEENETEAFFYTYEDPNDERFNPHGFAFKNWVKIQESFFPDPYKDHPYNGNKRPENTVYQTYAQWLNNLVGFMLTPTDRDVYCRIRPDMKFNSTLRFTDYDYSGKKIYIPQGNDFGGINDQFAFGNREVMKIYYSVFMNHNELWHQGVQFHSETMQLKNLEANGVEIIRLGYPQHDIIR